MLSVGSRPVALGLVEKIEHRVFDAPPGHVNNLKVDQRAKSTRQPANGNIQRPGAEERPELKPELSIVVKALQVALDNVGTHQAYVQVPDVPMPSALQQWSSSLCLEMQQLEVNALAEANTALSRLKENDWKTVSRGTPGVNEVSGLRPGRVYVLRAKIIVTQYQQVSEEHIVKLVCEPSDNLVFQTKPTAPGPPAPPALASRERKALKLKWSVPEETGGAGPLSYHLYVSPVPAELESQAKPDEEGFLRVYSGEERAYKIVKLTPGTKYTFRLRATNAIGDSHLSLCSSFTTQATVPSVPDAPVTVASTSNSITLQWSAPAENGSPITSYQLEQDDGRGGDFSMVYAGIQTMFIASGLRSGLQYRFRVKAENDEGRSMWSQPAVATTAAVPPASPCGLTVVGATRAAATLKWNPPDDAGGSRVVVYEVQLQAKGRAAVEHMGNDWLRIFEGDAQACTINSLRAGCTYRARVRARNAAGWGQFSVPVDVATAAGVPEAPEPPNIGHVEPTLLGVQWQAPSHDGGAKVSGYRLEVAQAAPCACGQCPGRGSSALLLQQPCEAALPDSSVVMPVSADERSAEIRDLQPGGVYFFRLQAINNQGSSQWSEWARLQTLPDVPCAPDAPFPAAVSSSSITVQWAAPDGQGAPVTSFVLEGGRPVHHTSSEPSVQDTEQQSHVEFRQLYRGPSTSYEVKGLEPATQYVYRVAAVNSVGSGPWSSETSIVSAPAAPGMPELLKASSLSSSEIEVNWHAPSVTNGRPVTSYVVEMSSGAAASSTGNGPSGKKASQTLVWAQLYSGSDNYCVATGLLPGKIYHFRVRAANACGFGAVSAPVSTTTRPAPPSAPARIQFGQRSATHVRLRWDAPEEENGAPVTMYQLEMAKVGDESVHDAASGWQVVYTGKESASKVQELQPGTKYTFRVAAMNAAGQGMYSAHESVSTSLAPPGPPEQMEVTSSGLDSNDVAAAWVVLSWQPPTPSPAAAPATSYEVEGHEVALPTSSSSSTSLAPTPNQQVAFKLTVGRGTTESRLEQLVQGTHYSVRLRSVGADGTGHSSWSTDFIFTTPGERPMRSILSADAILASAPSGPAPGAGRSKGVPNTRRAKRMASNSGATVATCSSGDSEDGSASVTNVSTKRGSQPTSRKIATAGTPAAKKAPVKKNMMKKVKGLLHTYRWYLYAFLAFVLFAAFVLVPMLKRMRGPKV
mmetsp:Transcript_36950/g.82146  ORF Transcript_36950/g.82146 Transcript_36950/m.82146 type:complete len:1201 (+) Transcript_36950:117-3719(+)|eukprot:CAMPEP_0202911422 /NCGR_PEP_ID=MMETSP1392-20130828/54947_1 /ASSEMBLY_ACC=CAM_ASM_000868 /TAXON_ID=225041 /ORGANISM="Chlamydomonas chlamydogama, Strain SAG 11-48b" /LENGTH=1200 /DNA_ID=CAMNT_0049601915 /DNA_START=77 /DNA_END=3679 /DNA_ORIENTATION=-